jgi:hypothetical protein
MAIVLEHEIGVCSRPPGITRRDATAISVAVRVLTCDWHGSRPVLESVGLGEGKRAPPFRLHIEVCEVLASIRVKSSEGGVAIDIVQ